MNKLGKYLHNKSWLFLSVFAIILRNVIVTSQYLPEKTSSLENQTNSETGSSLSGAEIESVSSSNNCVTKKEIKMTSLCSREHLKTKTETKTMVCCFFTNIFEKIVNTAFAFIHKY